MAARMREINSLDEILKLAECGNLYVRWSRGPQMDKAQGNSRDYVSGNSHNGLSAQRISPDNPRTVTAMMLVEYMFLRRKDGEIFGWLFTATETGRDSDNAPTVDASSIEPVARLSEKLVQKLSDYSAAYWAHRNYKPQTWAEGQAHLTATPKLSDYL